MSFFGIENLTLRLPGFNLQNLEINLRRGQVLVILGPSGAGKSILLETIAGFYRPHQGRVWLGDQDITGLPPEDRRIGFMFQEYALFPHRTVRQNVLFPLRFKHGQGEKRADLEPDQIMAMLHIDHLADRDTVTLSGGEKQRVALARALLREPNLFLFDEPMSALDARAREELREELGRLLKKFAMTAVFVTHDQADALALGDKVAIMQSGRIIQLGNKEEIFNHPDTLFAARFVGMDNLWQGRVKAVRKEKPDLASVDVEIESLGILTVMGQYEVKTGDEVFIGIRPENVRIEQGSEADDKHVSGPPGNIFRATVTRIVPWSILFKLHLQGGVLLSALLTRQELESKGVAEGKSVEISLPSEELHLIRDREL